MVDTPPVTHLWTKKSANHGVQRLLPIASPMGLQYPNKAHCHHPHIVGDVACAWFGRPMCGGRVIGFSTHIVKVLEFYTATIYIYSAPDLAPIVS